MISGKDQMILLYVPAGEFTMGNDSGALDGRPAHTVDIDAFLIDLTEVTNKMYFLCVEAGVCKEPTNKSSYTHSSYYGNAGYDNYPVIYVDWNMAKTYCEWAGRQLPTEAQWEKAARGTDANIYPWGNDAPNNNLLNYDSAIGDTTEVGKYLNGKSIYGALDMAGNVWEWVNDWYDVYPGGDLNASSDFGQTYRVLRGGSWNSNAYYNYYYYGDLVRSAFRLRYLPTNIYSYIGFRCAMSATP
jgi:formylglycine-generating enzyme required for sulfatase activity